MLDYASFPEQRQSLIRDRLRKEGRVVCTLLSQELQVSEHTIRRDLQELAREGACKRVYGGAVSLAPDGGHFMTRTATDNESKEALGQCAAALIQDGQCVFIDSGSTNLAIARAIPASLSVTVVTNSPAIAVEMMKSPHAEVIMLGGRVQPHIGGALGITPQKQLEKIAFDVCFLGGCALDVAAGLTVFDYEDAEFKHIAARKSSHVVVAMTADKLPAVARYHVIPCEEITTLVVESAISPEKLAPFIDKKIPIRIADAAQTT
ncbi:DeoR/GlpR family DNA-binding transcription regulator [Dickeya lacustris]|uniref:DeoR/GlpR family DNA-binding transcription regulator n=1 Tax=Dickeya lacustris TaxID=2259638 RepID=A0ABY8G8J9_9GAMM|nr:DeoR/GlpR family DNA-binding transcription regulator [Dickeya lacustris]WFN56261.1 DeoR/GlpR family DNA-binding transcription regulator [Dickeya lacustris]